MEKKLKSSFRIRATWMEWRYCQGLMKSCAQHIPGSFKGNIYERCHVWFRMLSNKEGPKNKLTVVKMVMFR